MGKLSKTLTILGGTILAGVSYSLKKIKENYVLLKTIYENKTKKTILKKNILKSIKIIKKYLKKV